ncbi:MAG TPA: hypothetical protein VIV14_06715 [Gammaproteobacteria bacterium]
MKSSFLAGIVLGLFAALGAARFYPWIDHVRVASRTTVLHNGGRLENFVIRLPVDRIASSGTPETGLRGRAFPEQATLPDAIGGGVLAEHFKLRDVDGEVIGIAARHSAIVDGVPTSAWALSIPSRGTMRLVGSAEPGELDRALAAEGRTEGRAWTGQLAMTIGADDAQSGWITGGSHEFDGLGGAYTEQWAISGVSQSGELRGTISLQTTAEYAL